MRKLKAGDEITWAQVHEDGSMTVRNGTVWSLAPRVHYGGECVWVIPSELVDTDKSMAVLVCRPGARGVCIGTSAGRWEAKYGKIGKSAFSEDSPTSPTGAFRGQQAKR